VLPQIITAKAAFEPAGSSTVWHSHDLLQIGLMRTGTVRIEFPQEAVEVSAGGFFAIAPRHLHRIGEVAYAVGFRDPATFSRAVRRHLGLAPSEVRRAMRAR